MVDSLVSVAMGRLSKIIQDEVALQMGVAEEVEALLSTFSLLQAMLQDAEGRRVNDESVMLWLEKLKDLAYDVDNILDEWTTEELRSQVNEGDGFCFSLKKVITFLFNCFNHAVFRHKIATEIKKAKKRLDDIAKVSSQLGLSVDNGARQRRDGEIRSQEIGERETGSLICEPIIVGRDDDVNQIRDLLVGDGSEGVSDVPTVVSIVGMGGLGKTTLAQLLYNEENVQHHFEMKMWVCVSEDFDVKRVTKLIIESATGRGCDPLALDLLQSRLRGILHGKRFLLVLDDMWSTDRKKWDQLKVPLRAGASGSRVIVTSRSRNVASAAGSATAHVHELSALSGDECWLLFSHYAFQHRNVVEYSELEEIGRKIVQKCGGVPLAAKAIGSSDMCTKGTRREWDIILQSETWSLQCDILPALLLSYYDLPSPLKQCFAYFSLFPKDSVMGSDQLVKLWMAQGFIPSEGSIGMEHVGGQRIHQLQRRSLLQDVELDDYGNIRSFKIHDLVHDLTQFVAKGDCSLLEEGNTNVDLAKVRHAFICLGKLREDAGNLANFDALVKAKKLRTAICRDRIPVDLIPNLFHHLRLLRALDLSGSKLVKLPQAIKKLTCPRYLNLSRTKIVELPEAVTDLYNLQTLKLNYCDDLCKLPEKMRKLISLRHLELEGTRSLKYMPCGIGRLTALHSLTKFIVGDGKKECGFGELKNLNHLQGKLCIKRLEKVVHVEEVRAAELDKKQYLNELILEYEGEEKVNGMLENIRPHSNLKRLTINGYLGYALPKWIEDPSFSNLVEIRLESCRKCKQLPCLGKLPSLKLLKIGEMEEVRHVSVEFCGVDDDDDDNSGSNGGGVSFPKLEYLSFSDMRNWEEWELRGGVVMMPSLLTLKISDCPKLKALPEVSPFLFDAKLPAFPNLKYLDISECNKIKSIQGGWLGELKALDELVFFLCPELECLPEELQHLTRLRTLRIIGCPILEERCKVGGEDWHKIEHIPNVRIVRVIIN